jgi:hypothetical protein
LCRIRIHSYPARRTQLTTEDVAGVSRFEPLSHSAAMPHSAQGSRVLIKIISRERLRKTTSNIRQDSRCLGRHAEYQPKEKSNEKLAVAQLVKSFSILHVTGSFVIVFTGTVLSSVRRVSPRTNTLHLPHPFNIILSSTPRSRIMPLPALSPPP